MSLPYPNIGYVIGFSDSQPFRNSLHSRLIYREVWERKPSSRQPFSILVKTWVQLIGCGMILSKLSPFHLSDRLSVMSDVANCLSDWTKWKQLKYQLWMIFPIVHDSVSLLAPFCHHCRLAKINWIQGCIIWHPNLVRLAPNGTNLGIFNISVSTFCLAEPKYTETDIKKSQIYHLLWHPWCKEIRANW